MIDLNTYQHSWDHLDDAGTLDAARVPSGGQPLQLFDK